MQESKRRFLALASMGVAVGLTNLGCSTDMPTQALAAWSNHNYNDIRHLVLSYAILAPSAHNLQSWKIQMSGNDSILLFCDTTRLLPQTDPLNRQIMLTQGTFLEFFKIAAQNFGFNCLTEFFHIDDHTDLSINPIAKIKLVKQPDLPLDRLFDSIEDRATNRGVYKSGEITPAQSNFIINSVVDYPVETVFSFGGAATLASMQKEIAKKAWAIECRSPSKMFETYKYIRIGESEINKYRDGICINDPIMRFLAFSGLFNRDVAPKPDDYSIKTQINQFNEKIDSTDNFLYVLTKQNDRLSQIKAGMAYARIQLAATKAGLSMHPLSQALQEYDEQKEQYKNIHTIMAKNGQTIQMWCRIGEADKAVKTPRRDMNSFIV